MNASRAPLSSAPSLYAEFLKRNRMFLTQERSTLLKFILSRRGHFSADELLFGMQGAGIKVSRATLYRALN